MGQFHEWDILDWKGQSAEINQAADTSIVLSNNDYLNCTVITLWRSSFYIHMYSYAQVVCWLMSRRYIRIWLILSLDGGMDKLQSSFLFDTRLVLTYRKDHCHDYGPSEWGNVDIHWCRCHSIPAGQRFMIGRNVISSQARILMVVIHSEGHHVWTWNMTPGVLWKSMPWL